MGHNAFCASKRPSIMWRVSRHQLLEATSKANKPTWLHTTLTHVYYTTSKCPAFGGDWWSNRDRYQGLIQNWSMSYLHPELPGPPRNHISVSPCNVRHLLLSSLPWLTLSGTKLRKHEQQQQQVSKGGGRAEASKNRRPSSSVGNKSTSATSDLSDASKCCCCSAHTPPPPPPRSAVTAWGADELDRGGASATHTAD